MDNREKGGPGEGGGQNTGLKKNKGGVRRPQRGGINEGRKEKYREKGSQGGFDQALKRRGYVNSEVEIMCILET